MKKTVSGLFALGFLASSAMAQDMDVEPLEAPEGAGPAYSDYENWPREAYDTEPADPAPIEDEAPDEGLLVDEGMPPVNTPDEEVMPEDPVEGAGAGDAPVTDAEEGSELDALAEPIPAIEEDAPPAPRPLDETDAPTVVAAEGTKVTLRGLDKITGRISEFEVPLDQPTQFGTILIVLKYCEKAPPEETPEVAAFLQIYDQTELDAEVSLESLDAEDGEDANAPVFSGWMFASSPAVSAMEHPIYDVWVIDCKSPAPSISADKE